MGWKIRVPSIAAVAATICFLFVRLAGEPWPEHVVTIDLAVDRGPSVPLASGYLHAWTDTEPPSGLVNPLRPQLFRMGAPSIFLGTYDRARGVGAVPEIVLSDIYGYPGRVNPGDTRPWPGDGGDWSRWERIVTRMVTRAKTHDQVFQWDIWGEPNGTPWRRSQAQFFETWRRAVVIIRSIEPTATIVGPSIVGFSPRWLGAFLDFAKDNNVLPDIISWHENATEVSGLGGVNIPRHANILRSILAAKGIPIQRFEVNEYLITPNHIKPGTVTWFFANLETAQVEGASRACWDDCYNATLNGLLTYPDRQPRPVWWAYKWYADITGRRVAVSPSTDIHGVAGYDGARGAIRAVLGNRNFTSGGSVRVRFVNLDAAGFPSGTAVRIIGLRADPQPVGGTRRQLITPFPDVESTGTVSNNQLVVNLSKFDADVAYGLTIEKAGGVTDVTSPTVRITLPSDRATIAGIITVTALASDGVGVSSVQFQLNGTNLGDEDTAEPYSTRFDTRLVRNGPHTMTALVRDTAGNSATSARVVVTVSNVSVPVRISPVAHWRFDEGSGTVASDSSGHDISGTLRNGSGWATGKIGGAIDLDGIDGHIALPSSAKLSMTSQFTVAAWVNTRGSNSYQRIFEHGAIDFFPYLEYMCGITQTRRVTVELDYGRNSTGIIGATMIRPNTWNHIACTWDGFVVRVYLNGAQDGWAPAAGTTITEVDNSSTIGHRRLGMHQFNGMMDDLRIYNRALFLTEIRELALVPTPSPTPSR